MFTQSWFIILLFYNDIITIMLNKTKRNKASDKMQRQTRRRKRNSSKPNYYNGIYTGIKGQCVEFVRRYLIVNNGVTFSDVDSAFQIPNAHFTTLNGDPIKMKNDLKVGSLIVWPKNYEKDSPHGHVAIVKSISPSGITVVERNYNKNKFSRFIKKNDLTNVTVISVPFKK